MDRVTELVDAVALQGVPARTRGHRHRDVPGAAMLGQDQDANAGRAPLELSNRARAAQAAQDRVDDNDVGAKGADDLERSAGRARFSYHFTIRIGLQDATETQAVDLA